MKYCCQKLEEFINNSETFCFDSIISERNGEFRIVKEVRSCDDGCGVIDTWIDEYTKINYCPFCGKQL